MKTFPGADDEVELDGRERARWIRLQDPVRARIATEAQGALPFEACGVLIGEPWRGGRRTVVERAEPASNVAAGDRRRRFAIAPETLLRVQKGAREQGLEIVGYYHSHPESPPVPSAEDRSAAWPDVSYVIAGFDGDEVVLRSWRLDPSSGDFVEEAIES